MRLMNLTNALPKSISSKGLILIFSLPIFLMSFELTLRTYANLPAMQENLISRIFSLFIVSFLLLFSSSWGRVLVLVFFTISIWIEVPHAIFYGNWANPISLFLLSENFSEVWTTIRDVDWKVIFISFLFIFSSLAFFLWFFGWISDIKGQHVVSCLVLAAFLVQPIKDGIFLADEIEKRFTKSVDGFLENSLNTYGVFTSLLVQQVVGKQKYPFYNHEPHPLKDSVDRAKVNILIYFGESLSSRYMSLFGYHKPTTPSLSGIKDKYQHTLTREAIAGSMATNVSTARFFHMIPYPDGRQQVASSKTNLFKYAKEAGFHTAYFTTQAKRYIGHIMSVTGGNYVQTSITPHEYDQANYGFTDFADDILLFEMLSKFEPQEPYFTVLQPVGSHVHFKNRSPLAFKKFGTNDYRLEYENSIFYTDHILDSLLEGLARKKSELPWVFIATSDHGTYVNKGIISREDKYAESYSVPLIIVTNDTGIYNEFIAPLGQCGTIFHQQIAETIANILGYEVPMSPCNQGVLNSDILSGVGRTHRVVINNSSPILTPYTGEFEPGK